MRLHNKPSLFTLKFRNISCKNKIENHCKIEIRLGAILKTGKIKNLYTALSAA
jgi:hypothetical protein